MGSSHSQCASFLFKDTRGRMARRRKFGNELETAMSRPPTEGFFKVPHRRLASVSKKPRKTSLKVWKRIFTRKLSSLGILGETSENIQFEAFQVSHSAWTYREPKINVSFRGNTRWGGKKTLGWQRDGNWMRFNRHQGLEFNSPFTCFIQAGLSDWYEVFCPVEGDVLVGIGVQKSFLIYYTSHLGEALEWGEKRKATRRWSLPCSRA